MNFKANKIFSYDSILLVSTRCGTYYSFNSGENWKAIDGNGFQNATVFQKSIYLSANNNYCSAGSSEFYKLILYNGSLFEKEIYPFEFNKPQLLYADFYSIYATATLSSYSASELGGFYYANNINNWGLSNEGLKIDIIPAQSGPWHPAIYYYSFFSLTGNDEYLFLGTSHGLYSKKLTAQIWEKVYSGEPANAITSVTCNESEIIITSQYRSNYNQLSGPVKVYKSTDNGFSWVNKFSIPECTVNELKKIDDVFFLATTGQGLYISSDNGEDWVQKSTGSFINIYSIEKHNDEYFIATDSGIFKNLNLFINTNNNIVCSHIKKLVKTDSTIAVIINEPGVYNNNSIMLSNDFGDSWNTVTSGFTNTLFDLTPVQNSFLISSLPDDSISNKFYLADQNGNNWNYMSSLNTGQNDIYSLYSNENKIIAGNYQSLLMSYDSGSAWTNININVPTDECGFNDVLIDSNNLFVAGNCDGQLYKSVNNGANWNYFQNGTSYDLIYSFGNYKEVLFAGGYYNTYRRFKTDNKWKICKALPGEDTVVTSFASDDKNIYACTSGRVYFSADTGTTWQSISGGLPFMCNNINNGDACLLAKDGYLYYGTAGLGIWRTKTSNLPFDFDIPDNEFLFNNSETLVYPNPANDKIYLSPLINGNTITRINIFSMDGRLVLVNSVYNILDVSMLISGLYIVVVETTNKNYYCKFVKQ